MVRVADLRVAQAQRHGVVVGLASETAQRIAAIADFLGAASEWEDLEFMFDELERHEGKGWKVPIDNRWWLAFEWTEGVGPVNVRLIE
jgi:plasmid maintenance system killer protein